MRVLAVGMSRSGTESLQKALHVLGFEHAYHGFDLTSTPGTYEAWVKLARKKYANADGEATITRVDFDRILGHCQAVTAFPCASFALELIDAYGPDVKVILNTRRDVDAWYKSITSTVSVRSGAASWSEWIMSFFSAELYWRRQHFEEWVDKYYHGSMRATAKWKLKEHVAMVKGSVETERLLEWSVEEGWDPLCRFLDIDVPKGLDFPRGNPPAEFFERVKKPYRMHSRVAWRNMLLTALALGTAMVGAVEYLRRL